MDTKSSPTKQEYRRESLASGRVALLISVLALVVSIWSLYETYLRQPEFTPHVATQWKYTRDKGYDDEILIVPLTITNNGARQGPVVVIEMTVSKGSHTRRFLSTGVIQAENQQAMFAPLSIQGRQAISNTYVFTSSDKANPIIVDNNEDTYQVSIKVCSVHRGALGVFAELTGSLKAPRFDRAKVLAHEQALSARTVNITADVSTVRPVVGEVCTSHRLQ